MFARNDRDCGDGGGVSGSDGFVISTKRSAWRNLIALDVDGDRQAAEVAVVVQEEPVIDVAFLWGVAQGVVGHAPLLGVVAYGVIVQNLQDAAAGGFRDYGIGHYP